MDPYSVAEIQRLLEEALKGRNGARWAIALALGLRQGETLGLRWKDVDLDTGTLRVRRNRLRPKYEHGCPGNCGRKYPGYCPDRKRANRDTDETKSRAGRLVIGLPDALVDLLKLHRDHQSGEREAAGKWWHDGGWLFATEHGEPLNPRSDYGQWKALLQDTGVRDGRLHDARHTAATVLLLLGVPERLVMSVMGWSSSAMAARYQHVTDGMRRSVAKQVDGLIWKKPDGPETGPTEAK